MGDPRLALVAQPVSQFDTPKLHQLIDDMRDTMTALDGAGLAAPQIGVSLRVVIFSNPGNSRYPGHQSFPETVLINPFIEIIGEAQLGMWEGCLSVPGLRGFVERPANIRYRGYDQYGVEVDRSVSGFHAVVVQHECDHLDGILYPARIKDFSRFGFEQQLINRTDYPN